MSYILKHCFVIITVQPDFCHGSSMIGILLFLTSRVKTCQNFRLDYRIWQISAQLQCTWTIRRAGGNESNFGVVSSDLAVDVATDTKLV